VSWGVPVHAEEPSRGVVGWGPWGRRSTPSTNKKTTKYGALTVTVDCFANGRPEVLRREIVGLSENSIFSPLDQSAETESWIFGQPRR